MATLWSQSPRLLFSPLLTVSPQTALLKKNKMMLTMYGASNNIQQAFLTNIGDTFPPLPPSDRPGACLPACHSTPPLPYLPIPTYTNPLILLNVML